MSAATLTEVEYWHGRIWRATSSDQRWSACREHARARRAHVIDELTAALAYAASTGLTAGVAHWRQQAVAILAERERDLAQLREHVARHEEILARICAASPWLRESPAMRVGMPELQRKIDDLAREVEEWRALATPRSPAPAAA